MKIREENTIIKAKSKSGYRERPRFRQGAIKRRLLGAALYACVYCAAEIITEKSGALSDAPPISPPSTCSFASSSAAFLAFIEPPY